MTDKMQNMRQYFSQCYLFVKSSKNQASRHLQKLKSLLYFLKSLTLLQSYFLAQFPYIFFIILMYNQKKSENTTYQLLREEIIETQQFKKTVTSQILASLKKIIHLMQHQRVNQSEYNTSAKNIQLQKTVYLQKLKTFFPNKEAQFQKLFRGSSQCQMLKNISLLLARIDQNLMNQVTNYLGGKAISSRQRTEQKLKFQKQQLIQQNVDLSDGGNSQKEDQLLKGILVIAQEEKIKIKQSLRTNRNGQQKWNKISVTLLVAKFRIPPKVKDFMVLELNFHAINLVVEYQTYDCPFLIFLIPFAYLLAESLAYYESTSAKSLTIQDILIKILQKINELKKSQSPQLSEFQIMDHLIVLMKLEKVTPLQLSKKLGEFLTKYQQKMKTFLPVFYWLFSFHAFQKYNFVESLQGQSSLRVRRQRLMQKIKEIQNGFKKFDDESI